MSILNKFCSEGAKGVIGFSIAKFILLLNQVIIARYLGINNYGIFTITISIISLLANFASLGLPIGIIRYATAYQIRNSLVQLKGILFSGAILIIFTSTIIMFLIWILPKSFFPSFEGISFIKRYAFLIPLLGTSTFFVNTLKLSGTANKLVFLRNILGPTLRLTIFLCLVYFIKKKIDVALLSLASADTTVLFFALFYHYRIHPFLFDKRIPLHLKFKSLVFYSFPLLSLETRYHNVIYLLITIFASYLATTDVSIYRVASHLAVCLVLLSNAFSIFYDILASQLVEEKRNITSLMIYALFFSATLSITIGTIFFIFSNHLMGIFGHDFVNKGKQVFRILIIGYGFVGATEVIDKFLYIIGHPKIVMFNFLCLVLLNIGWGFYFIDRKIIGISLATTISLLILSIVRVIEYLLLRSKIRNVV